MKAATNYTGNDFYCDVAIAGNVELTKEYESDNVLAFYHTKPFWPVHIVVVPKKHIDSFTTLSEHDEVILQELISVLKSITSKVEQEQGAARILTNTHFALLNLHPSFQRKLDARFYDLPFLLVHACL